VIFSGVVTYHFEVIASAISCFDIEEVPTACIIGDGKIFAERARLYEWPEGWQSNKERPDEFFSRMGCRLYEIHCSYGMYGWVAAKEMHQIIRAQ